MNSVWKRWALAGVLAAAPLAWAQPEPKPEPAQKQPADQPTTTVEPYQRITEDRNGEVVKLEMAVREFAPPKPGMPKVYLAAAIHIGDKEFYQSLQEFLDAQDVVLFEGVKPPGAGDAAKDEADKTDQEKVESSKRRARFLAMAVERYHAKQGKLPSDLAELIAGSEARIAGLLKSSTTDAWGHPLTYTLIPGAGDTPDKFDIVSLGADGKVGGEGPAADLKFSDQKPLSKPETGDRSEGIQSKLAKSMGLVFQLDAMDHNKPNWRNSDLSIDQVQARLDKAGASGDVLFKALDGSSMFGQFAGLLLGFLGSSPQSQAMLRASMMEMLSRADELLDQAPGKMGAMMGVLLEDRNAVVLEDLKDVIAEPAVKSIAVIYGGGHLPSMQRHLVEDLGYRPVGDTWRAAMQVDAKSVGMSAAQLRQMRQMISRSIESRVGRHKDDH